MSITYANTAHISEVALALKELLETQAGELELKRLYMEEPERIDAFPSAAVVPRRRRSQLNETGMMYTMQHELFVYYYYAKIQTLQKLITPSIQGAERIADAIIARDPVTNGPQTLNGLVYNLTINDLSSGTVRRGGARVRAVEISVSAQSRVQS